MFWETGRAIPRPRYMSKVIEFLGYDPFPGKPQTLSECLKRYRLLHGLSQTALATELGVSPDSIRSWEKEQYKPTEQMRKILREKLGNSVEFNTPGA